MNIQRNSMSAHSVIAWKTSWVTKLNGRALRGQVTEGKVSWSHVAVGKVYRSLDLTDIFMI
jgi:hypothetical protein